MKKLLSLLLVYGMLISIFVVWEEPISEVSAINGKSILYRAHVSHIGWLSTVHEPEVAGTTGQALPMEAFVILRNAGFANDQEIEYRAHVSHIGWQNYVINGAVAGTTGQALSIEAVQIRLINMPGWSVFYRTHMSGIGWGNWVSNNTVSGTTGQNRPIEAIQIYIVDNSSASNTTYARKLEGGPRHSYWVASGNGYLTSISSAVNGLMWPGNGMSNRMDLWRTTNINESRMDFYQINSNLGFVARTSTYRMVNGQYRAMPLTERETHDWVYGEIEINHALMQFLSPDQRRDMIIHEMMHVYGAKDLPTNPNSVMFWHEKANITGLTSDANAILNAKY